MKQKNFQIMMAILWNAFFLTALVWHLVSPLREYSFLLYRENSWFTVITILYGIALVGPLPFLIMKLLREEGEHLKNGLILAICIAACAFAMRVCYLAWNTTLLEGEMQVTSHKENYFEDGHLVTIITKKGDRIEALCNYEDFCRLKPGYYNMSVIWNWEYPNVGIVKGVYEP